MCIFVSLSHLAKQSTAVPNLIHPGQGEGLTTDLDLWEFDDQYGTGILSIPLMQGSGDRMHALATVQVALDPEEAERAARHAPTLAPYDYLAGRVFEEEAELDLALEAYAKAQGRHAQNEAWSHVMSEAADVANTRAAWLLKRLPASHAKHVPRLFVQAAVYRAAIIVCRATTWPDVNGAPVEVKGHVDEVTQRLLADVRPVADAVAAAAVAKTAEVAIRPHGRCSQ
jgi:hypothetical protein